MVLTPDELARYRARGFPHQRGLLASDEVELVLAAAALAAHAFERADGEGGRVRVSAREQTSWLDPRDDRSAKGADR